MSKAQPAVPENLGTIGNDEPTEEYKNPEILQRLYWDKGLSQGEIGELFGVNQSTISYWMRRLGIETRANYQKPPSVTLATGGYPRVCVRNPDGGYDSVAIHRLAAVAEWGFEAVADSNVVVHHRNGCPFDFSMSNLEILTHSEHAQRHYAYDGTSETI